MILPSLGFQNVASTFLWKLGQMCLSSITQQCFFFMISPRLQTGFPVPPVWETVLKELEDLISFAGISIHRGLPSIPTWVCSPFLDERLGFCCYFFWQMRWILEELGSSACSMAHLASCHLLQMAASSSILTFTAGGKRMGDGMKTLTLLVFNSLVMLWMWNVLHRLLCLSTGPQLVALFWENLWSLWELEPSWRKWFAGDRRWPWGF